MLDTSSCHEEQLDDSSHEQGLELESQDCTQSLFGSNVVQSSKNAILKKSSSSDSYQRLEIEEGELIEGIEANDVSGLLEQFLEYEERQGSLGSSLTSLDGVGYGTNEHSGNSTRKLNMDSLGDAENFSILLGAGDNRTACPGHVFKNLSEVHCDAVDWSLTNGVAHGKGSHVHNSPARNSAMSDKQERIMKTNLKCPVDNHETDHNYACSGFPRRTSSVSHEKTRHFDNRRESKCMQYKDLLSESDSDNENYRKVSRETERKWKCSKQERSRYDRAAYRSRSRSPLPNGRRFKTKSYRDHSNSEDETEYWRRRFDCRSRSSFSSDDKNYSSLDEDSSDERRYNPREAGSGNLRYRRYSPDHSDSERYSNKKRKQSRSNSPGYNKTQKITYNIEQERKLGFKFDRKIQDSAKEERRIIYIGKIARGTSEDDVWERFRPFGPIEKVTVHFRDKGDNYAFVTYFEHSSAADAIEQGNDDPRLPVLDICFGGRRKFCGGSYVDFDSNTSVLEEQEVSRPPSPDEMDFDALLEMSQRSLKHRRSSYKGR